MEPLCPGCNAAVSAGARGSCPTCGLDLTGREAAELRQLAGHLSEIDGELWAIGERRQQVAVQLSNRRWVATGGANGPLAWGAGTWGAGGTSGTASDSGQPPPAARPPLPPRPRPPLAPRPPSAEWSVDRVRSLLLWVGAALLTASALTFTTVAWARLGNGGRAVLLAGVTALCVTGALALRRRLPATAEAFTALSIALALIDWQALRRAGATAGMSATAAWAVGSLAVSTFAFALGTVVGKRTSRAAVALLVPLGLELAVSTVAGAPWSVALGFALVAAAAALAWRFLHDDDDRPARVALSVHVVSAWTIAGITVLVATTEAHTLAQAFVPAAVMLTLTLAPLALMRRDTAPGRFDLLATLVCAATSGAFVVAASTSFGPQGVLAWATIVAAAAVALAPSLPHRWTKAACVAGIAFGFSGLAFGTVAALSAIFGPLAWLGNAWHGSLAVPARTVFAGPHSSATWHAGGPAVVALIASMAAVASAAVSTRRRRALISETGALGGVATIAMLIACVTPVIAGASVGVVCATAALALSALLVGMAVLDRTRPQLAAVLLPIAIVPAVATTGWAALTATASVTVLALGFVVALFATAVARSDGMRIALGAACGATAIALAGFATAAAGSSPATAGFAAAATAAIVILAGVHGRKGAPEGAALEVTGATALLVGAAIASQQTPWFAGTLTLVVPAFGLAALRRDRRVLYSVAAGAAALAATWAWLAAANVTIVEAYTAPAAAVALGAGLLAWRRGPARSWLALGPAIVLGLGPTLLVGIAQDDAARTIIAAVAAFAIVVLGAWKRLQAPLVLGSAALLTLAIATFGPDVARLPRWLPPAVIGLLLMWIGATFETRRDRAKSATQNLLHFG
jgi:hypothetical protein